MKVNLEVPLQTRVQNKIKEYIKSHDLRAGDRLPIEAELLQLFQIGRSTLREAMANLESQGVIQRQQGKGTFIRQLPLTLANGLDELRSVTEHIKAVGAVPSTSRMDISYLAADSEFSEKLSVPVGEALVKIERVRRADDKIAAFCVDILPRKFMVVGQEVDFGGSLFELLAQKDHHPDYAESSLTPTVLTQRDLPEMAQSLGVFMLFEEVFYSRHGDAVCYSNDYYNADIFDFKIIRRRQNG